MMISRYGHLKACSHFCSCINIYLTAP